MTIIRSRGQAGFTVIELLAAIAIIGVTGGLLLPAAQRLREAAVQVQSANLTDISRDLGRFATDTDKVFQDDATLSLDTYNAGPNGTLSQANLQQDLLTLCTDLTASNQDAATLLAKIKHGLAEHPTPAQKQALTAAKTAVVGWTDDTPQLIGLIGPLLVSGSCSASSG